MPSLASSASGGREQPRDNGALLTIVRAQIVFRLSTLTEDNFERNQIDIRSLAETNGIETYLHFIRRLITASQARLSPSQSNNATFDNSIALTFRLLVQETQRLARDPFLADRFRDGIDKGEGEIFRNFDLIKYFDRVGLRPLERLVLAASIVSANTRKELAQQAQAVIRVEWTNAVLSLCNRPSFEHADLSPSQVAKLLSNLLSDPPADFPVLDPNQRHELLLAAWTKYGPDIMSPILQQIFPTISLSPGTTVVQALNQLGPELTSDADIVRALLLRFGVSDASPPQTMQVVEIIVTLSRTAMEGKQICDVAALVRALATFVSSREISEHKPTISQALQRPALHWPSIIRALDRPERSGVDTGTLKLTIAILLNAPRDSESHAVAGFWTIWSNTTWQVKLLDALLSLPGDTFSFVSLPGRRIVTIEDVTGASPTIKSLAANVQGNTWNSLDLIETLVKLGDLESPETKSSVREVLDKAVKISAELIHMGLLQVPKPWGPTQHEYSEKLLAMFLAGHPNHQLVFMRIWQIDPTYLMTAFHDFYDESSQNITRILDVAQDLKILEPLLEMRPFTFALDVAALASRREYLNLDKWLADNVNTHRLEFIHSIFDFLDTKLKLATEAAAEGRPLALNPHTLVIFLRTLRSSTNFMTAEDIAAFHEIRNRCCQIYPRLMDLSPVSDAEPGLSVVSFPQEVEAEVESIYRQMYEEHITAEQVIALLQKSAQSHNPRDHEVFACTLYSLFDEYRYFNSTYPTRELGITAQFFGALIQYEVINSHPLGIAIRFVLDALRSPSDSNLFKFGTQALARFESRLYKWPDLCRTILSLPNLPEVRPDLIETVREIVAHGDSGDPEDLIIPAFPSIRADRLTTQIEAPGIEETDKILFIINNLASNNFEQKTAEMQERFKDEHSRWFANYLVDQRISMEPNNHDLYMRFLDSLRHKQLFKYVLHETLVKSAKLLNSDQTVSSASDRTVLKNLASWLGALTLARNRPIKHRNISFKDLLLEGYDNNRLIVSIPFVCKILEQGKYSVVFKPPNPWLMGVISLLAELYHFAELRLNLKFEIEVTCRAVEIELDKVEATTILRNRPSTDPLTAPQLPDYVNDIDSLPLQTYEGSQSSVQPAVMSQLGSSSPSPQAQVAIEGIISGLPTLVVISPQLGMYASNAGFKRAIQSAIERSVREIIMPVIERSVTIAGISTRELVVKDFVLEANEEKMRKAAHLMAQNLAGNLAMVTCKEPLRTNMANNLRLTLAEQGFGETISENVIQTIVNDNINYACAAIERAAMERAVAEVDEGFASAYEQRRNHRENRPGQPFWDTNSAVSPFTTTLPDILRIKPGGLSFAQTRVYEEFGREGPRLGISRPPSANFVQDVYDSPSPVAEETINYSTPVTQLTHQQCMERFAQLIAELERLLATGGPSANEVQSFIRQVLQIAGRSVERDETALAFSQKTVLLLFKTTIQLGRELYVLLLQKLCETWPKVAKEAIDWLLFAEDERKFNVPVTMALIRSRLISPAEQDMPLAKMVSREFGQAVTHFAVTLVREAVLGEDPCATKNQFANTIEALSRAVTSNVATPEILRLLEDMGLRRPAPFQPGTPDITEGLMHHFADWVRIYQRSPSSEKAFVGWVTQVTAQGILRGEDLSSLFYRVCVETSVQMYHKFMAAGESSLAFQPIDALSRLITLMIKYNGDASSTNAVPTKVHYLTKILSIVVLVLARAHEDETVEFKQRPFFRLFSSLLADLSSIESNLQTAYFHLLIALCAHTNRLISDTFNTLQPIYFPGFAFSWMSLISHRLFLPKLLLSENREGWTAFHRLLLSLFKFLAPFLRTATLHNAVGSLYRGSLSLLLVLLHDFPEFLSEYYFSLCDVIPSRCVQLRNIILSAYPLTMKLPDPYVRDQQPDMGPIPPILSDFTVALSADLRATLDQYLLGRGSQSSLPLVLQELVLPGYHVGGEDLMSPVVEKYHLLVMNALVMFVGVSSVAQAKARTGSPLFVASDPGVTLLHHLASELDAEGQHHLIGSIGLHLRYPNAHTHWFSSLLLHLFNEINVGKFQEVVTTVLFERFLVHRPHPWGLTVTFIELLRNPRYEFWKKDFLSVAPEITELLTHVSRSF
ncbi:hypothetical protein FRB96_006246 [Tulasnella sp. 330]|nr:hypothetical protein FRB96_006246 [Tulasnella sp. 330]